MARFLCQIFSITFILHIQHRKYSSYPIVKLCKHELIVKNNLLLKLSDIYYSQLCTFIYLRDYVKLIKTNFLRSVEKCQNEKYSCEPIFCQCESFDKQHSYNEFNVLIIMKVQKKASPNSQSLKILGRQYHYDCLCF